jgi:hypothetical protein
MDAGRVHADQDGDGETWIGGTVTCVAGVAEL